MDPEHFQVWLSGIATTAGVITIPSCSCVMKHPTYLYSVSGSPDPGVSTYPAIARCYSAHAHQARIRQALSRFAGGPSILLSTLCKQYERIQ